MTDVAPETPGVVIGNTEDKYGTEGNAAIRWLTQRWVRSLGELWEGIADASDQTVDGVVEVGCGEGEVSQRLHDRFGAVTGLDLPDAGLRANWRERSGPRFLHADAHSLPLADRSADLVVCVEVLEHVGEPDRALAEIARVARRDILLSVPREPLFRGGNLVAGRHVKDLGNTPGHLNHWSTPSFLRFVSQAASIRAVRLPLPWTVVWARVR